MSEDSGSVTATTREATLGLKSATLTKSNHCSVISIIVDFLRDRTIGRLVCFARTRFNPHTIHGRLFLGFCRWNHDCRELSRINPASHGSKPTEIHDCRCLVWRSRHATEFATSWLIHLDPSIRKGHWVVYRETALRRLAIPHLAKQSISQVCTVTRLLDYH